MKIQATFYPGVNKSDLEAGRISEISWQRMSEHLDKIFAVKENERLVGVTVTEYGIKAKIEIVENK
jgi:hypothetical protein